MMKQSKFPHLRWGSLVAGLLLIAGCFGGEHPQTHHIPPLRSDLALVCFYRPARDFAAARGFRISEAGKPVGVLDNGTCFFTYVSPGPHVFALDLPFASTAYCQVNTNPNSEYYVSTDASPSLFSNKAEIQLVPTDVGRSRIYTLRQKMSSPPFQGSIPTNASLSRDEIAIDNE
jgi:hypothetical protein